MEPGERAGKTVRRTISVLHRNVDNFDIRFRKLLCCKAEPAVPDIFPYRETTQSAEHPLEMERRNVHFFSDFPDTQFLRDVFLDIPDRILNALDPPVHTTNSSTAVIPL